MTEPLTWTKASSSGTELVATRACKSEIWDNAYDDIEFKISHNRPANKWRLSVATARKTAEPLVGVVRDLSSILSCVTAANDWVKNRESAAEKASQRRAAELEHAEQYKAAVTQELDTFLAANPTIAEDTTWSN